MGAQPYGAQLGPQQQSKNLPRVNPPAEVSNPISIIRERKKTTRWVIFSFLAYLPLVDTMHHVLKAWCIILWVRF